MLRRRTVLVWLSLSCGCSLSASATGVGDDAMRDASSRPARKPSEAPATAEASATAEAPATAEDADEDDQPPSPPPEPEDEPAPSPTSHMMDAGAVLQMDASSVDAAREAGRDASVYLAAPGRVCAGSSVLGGCWYLGERGLSCEQVCADHGGFDPSSVELVGTRLQGGSLTNCAEALGALGVTGPVLAAARFDGEGVGCHRWGAFNYWLASSLSPFNESIAAYPAEIACACAR